MVKFFRDRFGHRVKVNPKKGTLGTIRSHYKRSHPRAWRASIRKGVSTRALRARRR